ncbi:hypothetical protein EJB05_36317, partial [Eragrostis curvula]
MDKSRHDKAAVGVGGRLRQRLAQILVRSPCATTTTSATSFVSLAGTNAVAVAAATTVDAASRQEPTPAGHTSCAHDTTRSKLNDDSSQRRHHRQRSSDRALVHISIDCSARSVGAAAVQLPSPMPVPAKRAAVKSRRRRRRSKGNAGRYKTRASSSYGWSSSTDGGELATFGSDDDGERADTARSSTLFSSRSRSFSSDSTSDFYTTATGGTGARSKNRLRRRAPAPPRAGTFRPSVSAADEMKTARSKGDRDGAVAAAAGSMAVVKRSHDPYADFRSSMAEMLAGRGIRGADALSELLVWYLSLNSPEHHPVILAAFEDVLGNDT